MAKINDKRNTRPVDAETGDVLVCWQKDSRIEPDYLMIIETLDGRYNILSTDTSKILLEESVDSCLEAVKQVEADYWFVEAVDESDVVITLSAGDEQDDEQDNDQF